MKTEKEKSIEKVAMTLKLGRRSEKTILNYTCAIDRFFNYYNNKDISKFEENDIIEYLMHNYIDKGCSANTYNMNIYAIKFLYGICFSKEFNCKLLPHAKVTKKLPLAIDNDIFNEVLNNEKNLKYKCWLLLAFYSGLRVDEVAKIKIENIDSKEHKLKVLGKGKKERLTFLPDITIKYLRLYYKSCNLKITKGYLFDGILDKDCMNSKTITNYFSSLKRKYNLDNNLSFHSLRHSFATNFIKNGGDLFVLKSMLGHSSLNTTGIYVHVGKDFNNLKGCSI